MSGKGKHKILLTKKKWLELSPKKKLFTPKNTVHISLLTSEKIDNQKKFPSLPSVFKWFATYKFWMSGCASHTLLLV